MQDNVAPTNQDQSASLLVEHSAGQRWGTGLLMWERDGRRGYQFEDGNARVFESGWFHLLRPVPEVSDELEERLRTLALANGVEVGGPTQAAPTLDEQIDAFNLAYPAGFADPRWISQRRGTGKRALKRHRDPAIVAASDRLGREALMALIAGGTPDLVRERVLELLTSTDLVSGAQLEPLNRLVFDDDLATAMLEFLHDEDDEGRRMDHLRLGLARAGLRAASWPLLTAARALTQPTLHVCVRPSVVQQQAQCLGLASTAKRHANPSDYLKILGMFGQLRAELIRRGHTPRDLLDVLDFSTVTAKRRLTTAAKKTPVAVDAAN